MTKRMTFKQTIHLLFKLVKYNMKIIFAGKIFWFILAALAFFLFFMVQVVLNSEEMNEGVIYELLLFPGALLIFYPTVFGIQNDEDARMLEILFGIPNYKYKVWGVRLLMIYLATFFLLVGFAYLASLLLCPVNPFEMAAQLMFPVLFYGNLAFMFSTITRSGNGTAVVMIILSFVLFVSAQAFFQRSYWNILLNPFTVPRNFLPAIWEGIILKNRALLLVGSIIWMMIGLLNLQKREKFV